ncbi:Uncharacterised protein [Vibrio cholerae]|nr:Uncharacterised protein [Vibrio cholerae]
MRYTKSTLPTKHFCSAPKLKISIFFRSTFSAFPLNSLVGSCSKLMNMA